MDIYRIISNLEYDSAAAYLRLKDNDQITEEFRCRAKGREDMLDYMIRESYRNAREVEASGWGYRIPVFDEYRIEDLQKKIKDALCNAGKADIRGFKELLISLAASEKALSQIYELTSAHFEELSQYFHALSRKFEDLAHEEKSHSRMIEPLINGDS